MNVKKLQAKLRRARSAARAKLAEITAETHAEDATRIEAEHATLLAEVDTISQQIRAARKTKPQGEDEDARAASDDDEDDDDSDDGEEDDEGDDGDDAGGAGRRGMRSLVAGVLTRSATIELTLVFDQARDIGVDLGRLADAIKRNETPDLARQRLFKILSDKSKSAGPGSSANAGDGRLEVIRDEREGVADAMQIALIQRLLSSRGRSPSIEYKPTDIRERAWFEAHRKQSEAYLAMGLVDMAAACINYRGRGNYLTTADALRIFERAFQSTSDFPNIFQNALNKALLSRYTLATPTYREIAAERTFNDFRPHPQIRAGDFPQLMPVLETGELQYGSTTDNGESISVSPYGVIFTISRTMLVNDDLGAIDQILGSAGDMVLVFENVTFYTMFLSNPTLMQDNNQVFSAPHNNLVASGSGAAPSVATIAAARQSLRQMRNISGNLINVPPAIILTGPVQETAADQMVTAITPTLTASVNPFSGRLRSVSDANITDTSWYIATDPARVPTFIYGFLAGSGGPRTRTYEPFGTQGVKISLEHDFGVGAIDYRGFYKNAGD